MSDIDFTQFLIDVAGLPAYYADIIVDNDLHAANGWLDDNNNMLSKLIGRPTTPINKSIIAAL